MAKKTLIYEATTDFYLGGQYVRAGATAVQGHAILKGRTHLFRPFVPSYGELEEEPEPTKAAQKTSPKKSTSKPEPKAAAKTPPAPEPEVTPVAPPEPPETAEALT